MFSISLTELLVTLGFFFGINLTAFIIFRKQIIQSWTIHKALIGRKQTGKPTIVKTLGADRSKETIQPSLPQPKVPDGIKQEIASLRRASQIIMSKFPNNYEARDIASNLDEIYSTTEMLFKRIPSDELGGKSLIALEYKDKLNKLSYLVSDRYLIDILHNPDFWRESNKRISEVHASTQYLLADLKESMLEINSRHDIQADVANSSIASKQGRIKIKDLYGDKG